MVIRRGGEPAMRRGEIRERRVDAEQTIWRELVRLR